MKKTKKIDRSMKMRIPLNFVIDDQATGLSVEIDIPGVQPADIKLSVEDNQIVLSAQRLGVPFGQRFGFNLTKFDPSTVDADLALGVLQVTMSPRPTLGVITVPVTAITGSTDISV